MAMDDQHTQVVEETTINLAQQIRMLRERRSLSQRALAEASGLSRNTLSLLERGLTSPTVSTLKRLAIALNVDISAFFEPFDEAQIVYTKSYQRPHLSISHGTMADLGAGLLEQLVTPLVLCLEPGAQSGEALAHDGQDFVYCLSGEVLYKINGNVYLLEQGDSLLFNGHLPHRFQNSGDLRAEILVILSTPLDGAEYIAHHFPD